jgi:hypothetical protein
MDRSGAIAASPAFVGLYQVTAEGQTAELGEREFHARISRRSLASGAAHRGAGRNCSRRGVVQTLDSVEVGGKKAIIQRARNPREREDIAAAREPRGGEGAFGIQQCESGE